MAEGTKVGTGYVDVDADFSRYHRSLDREAGRAPQYTRGLADGFRRSLSPALDDVSRKLRAVGREVQRDQTALKGFGGEMGRARKATDDTADATKRVTDRLGATRAAIDSTRASVGGFGDDLRKVRTNITDTRVALSPLSSELDRARTSMRRIGDDVRNSSTGFQRFRSFAGDTDLVGRSLTRLGSRTTVVNQRFQLLRNALGVLRWPAIITGAGLAAQALSALGAAAAAVTAAVGPAVGVLAALPGALAAAAQGFGVFKLATLGIGDALREQIRNQTAAVGGAGRLADASRAVEAAERGQFEAARQLTDAKLRAREAEDGLRTARDEAARALVDGRREVVRATLDEERATIELREARAALKALQAGPDELDLADARDRTADATRDIAQAERDYQTEVARTNAILADPTAGPLAQQQARADLVDAEDRIADARRGLTRATRDLNDLERGPSRRDLARARLDVRDAEVQATDATLDRKRAVRELDDLERRGIRNSAQMVQARRDLAEAQRGVEDAEYAVADAARAVVDAQADMAAGQATAAGTAASLNEEFDKLPKSAQAFVRSLLALRPRFDELRAVAADGFFPGAGRGLTAAMRSFGPIRQVVAVTSRVLGGLADQAGRLVGSRGFGRDLELVGGRNAVVIRRVGGAVINTTDALRHLIVAAGPLVGWLSRVTLGWSRSLRETARAGRESGRTAAFLERTRAVLERLGSITGNVARAFRGIARAAYPLGTEILGALDRASERFANWSNSIRGQASLGRYFRDARPAIWEMGRLLRDVTKSFFRLGSQPGVARLLRQVRTELLPALERLLATLQQSFGPAIVSALTSVVELFSQLAGAGGILSSIVKMFDGMASAASWLLENVPGFRALTFAVLGTVGAFAALRIAAVITGFATLARTVSRVAAAYSMLKAGQAAASVAGSAGLAATGAAQVAASGRMAALFSPAGVLRSAGGRAGVALAGSRLGNLLGSNITAGIGAALGGGRAGAGAGFGGAAAGAAGGGLLGGLRGKLMRGAKIGGMAGVGILLADQVFSEFDRRSRERSPELLEAIKAQTGRTGLQRLNILGRLPGGVGDTFRPENPAEQVLPQLQRILSTRSVISRRELADVDAKVRQLSLTKEARAEYQRILSVLRQGSRLRLGVSTDMDLAPLRRVGNAFRLLRSGALTSLRDILRVSRRNMALISQTWGDGTAEGRRAAARNMRLTADAIATQMRRSGRVTNDGVQRIVKLLREADLISPTRKLARDFGREWARGMDSSKEITRRGVRQLIAEAQRMPGPMRKVALDTWLAQLEAARKNRRITAREFADLRSRVATEFTGMRLASRDAAQKVPQNVGSMTTAATGALAVLAGNTNKALDAFGVRPLVFSFEKVRAQRRQQGGAISTVPGVGSGDKVPALLEPGEVVVNRTAVRAMGGAQNVHRINELIPRFSAGRVERHQAGGIAGGSFNVDGAKPGFVPFMNYLNSLFGPIYVMSGLRPGSTILGSGRTSNHASGDAVDISTQQNGLNFVSAPTDAIGTANLNATGIAAKRMDALYAHMARWIPTSRVSGDFLWRTTQGGNHYNHIHRGITNGLQNSAAAMAQFLSTLPEGSGFGALQRVLLAGPDGPLRRLGQSVIDRVYKAANAYVARASAVPTYGTGTIQAVPHAGGGKVVGASVFGDPVDDPGTGYIGYRDNDLRGQDAYAELGMGTLLGNLPYRHPLTIAYNGKAIEATKQDIGGGGDPIQGHSTDIDIWHETADKLGIHGLWKGLVQISGLQRGGIVEAFQRGGIADRVDRIRNFLRRPLRGRNNTASGFVAKTLRMIQGIGLSPEFQAQLTGLSNNSDAWAEFAQRAGGLSYEMTYAERTPALKPDGTPILDSQGRSTFHEIGDPILDAERRPMTFLAEVGGKNEAGWTNERLGALFNLRNKLVQAAGIVRTEQERVARLIEQTRRRIAEIQDEIRRAARRRRQVETRIASTVEAIRTQRTVLETARDDLEKLNRRPRRNRAAIERTRERISGIVGTIGDLGRRRDRLVGEVRDIDGRQATRRRTEAQLLSVLGSDRESGAGGGLLGRSRAMADYLPDVLGGGGDGFKGLITVQGLGGPGGLLSSLPPIGTLGGEIFDAQEILRQLAVKPNPVPLPEDADEATETDDSERLGLIQQLLTESQQRYAISQAQYRVLEGWPAYGGSFSTGGMVPGAVGEARTIIAHGGERVLSVADQQAGIGGTSVAVIVEKGAGVDESKIRVVAADEAQRTARQLARIGARRMPGLRSA